MEEVEFFYNLLEETGEVFNKSPIKEYQLNANKKWNYSICDTPIQRKKAIILGLNWGGDNNDQQFKYPDATKERDWNFMKNSNKYFKQYLNINDIGDINYSNLCFFRSPKIKYLTLIDWQLALPLFQKYVSYIEPTWTLLLGNSGISFLRSFNHLTAIKSIEVKGKNKRIFAYNGSLFGKYQFYCVPHPQARISTEGRENIWKELFNTGQIS